MPTLAVIGAGRIKAGQVIFYAVPDWRARASVVVDEGSQYGRRAIHPSLPA
jgi:hypothetical protein